MKGGGHDIIEALVSQSSRVRQTTEELGLNSLCPGQHLKLEPTTRKSNPYHLQTLAKCRITNET
jgi:hypothetical protein